MRTLAVPYALFSYMRAQHWTKKHICGPGMVMCKIGELSAVCRRRSSGGIVRLWPAFVPRLP